MPWVRRAASVYLLIPFQRIWKRASRGLAQPELDQAVNPEGPPYSAPSVANLYFDPEARTTLLTVLLNSSLSQRC